MSHAVNPDLQMSIVTCDKLVVLLHTILAPSRGTPTTDKTTWDPSHVSMELKYNCPQSEFSLKMF